MADKRTEDDDLFEEEDQPLQQQQQSQSKASTSKKIKDEDPSALRSNFSSSQVSLQAKALAIKFRTSLLILLLLYIFLYILENVFQYKLPSVAPGLLLLFLGWYAQDLYRMKALKLYYWLSLLSIIIDIGALISSIFAMVDDQVSTFFIVVLCIVFLIEEIFKIASIIHSKRLLGFLVVADRTT